MDGRVEPGQSGIGELLSAIFGTGSGQVQLKIAWHGSCANIEDREPGNSMAWTILRGGRVDVAATSTAISPTS